MYKIFKPIGGRTKVVAKSLPCWQAGSAGFTLIELLVVISIISMLSSIVLAGMKQARDKAYDLYTKNSIRVYQDAFTLNQQDRRYFPLPPLQFGSPYACLGPVGTTCYNYTPPASPSSIYQSSAVFNSQISEYVDVTQEVSQGAVSFSSGRVGKGIIYTCTSVLNSQCLSYAIYWNIRSGSPSTACGLNGKGLIGGAPGPIYCRYSSDKICSNGQLIPQTDTCP